MGKPKERLLSSLSKTSSIWSHLSRVGVACTHAVCPRSVSSYVDEGYMAMVGPGHRAGPLLLASQTYDSPKALASALSPSSLPALQLLWAAGTEPTALLPAQPRACSPRRTPQQQPLAAKQKGSWDLYFASVEPVISPTQPPPQAPISAASGDYLRYTCWCSKEKQ